MVNFSVSSRRLVNNKDGSTTSLTIMGVLTDAGEIYAYVFGHWYRAHDEPLSPIEVTVGPGGFWCLDRAGNIHKWNEDPIDSEWVKDTIVDNVSALSCDADGNLWCINKEGDLYFSNRESPAPDRKTPCPAATWMKAAFEGAWFFGDTWEYTTRPGDHLLTIVRNKYQVTDDDTVYHIAEEIMRLNKLHKKLDSIKQAG